MDQQNNNLGDEQILDIVDKFYSADSQTLTISKSQYKLHQILNCQDWSMVKEISLLSQSITDEEFMSFGSLKWPLLFRLDLYNNNLGTNTMKELLLRCDLSNLTILELNQNQINTQSIKYLTKINLPQLTRLFLGWDHIGNEGATLLCKGYWPNLIEIALGSCKIGYDGAQNISNFCRWKLQVMWYRYNCKCVIGVLSLATLQMGKNSTIYSQHKWQCLKQVESIKECSIEV